MPLCPQIVTTAPRHYAALRLTIAKDAIQREMGPGLRELHGALEKLGVTPAGAWFTHHLRIEPARWDFEIGLPVAAPIAAAGRVQPAVWAPTSAAHATLSGGYEGLAAAWGELDAWIAQQGRARCDDLFEIYTAGPEAGADPSAWRTELYGPLRAL